MTAQGPTVVTALGVTDAAGFEAADLLADLVRGRQRITSLGGDPARRARQVDDDALIDRLTPRRARRMSRPSQFAVAAAETALAGAGLAAGSRSVSPAATSIAVATTFGPLSYTVRLLDQMRDEGATAASPALFTECVANAPAAQVSIATGATGAHIAVCQREAGALIAVGAGCNEITKGRADRALVGCTDEVTAVQHAVLSRFRATSGSRHGDWPQPQPFDIRRDGFLLAEGSCMLVCEPQDEAERRSARPMVRVLAHGSAFDPSASRAGWGSGASTLARSLAQWLQHNGIALDSVDLIVSGASGSRAGDLLEGRMLRRIWGDTSMPPVAAPKEVTGEYSGGFLAAAMLAAQGRWEPCAEAIEVDPEIGITLATRPPSSPPLRTLVTCCAAGGATAWLLLERV